MAQVSFCIALVFLFLDLLQCYNHKLEKPKISPECELVGICDSVDNYPTKLVKGLIDKLKSQNTIFNYEEAPLPMITHRTDKYDEDRQTWIKKANQIKIERTPQPILMFENIYEHPVGIHISKKIDSHENSFRLKKKNKKLLSLCETKTQFVPPKSALDMNGNWQFIINDSEEPVQVFKIQTCRAPMGRCSEDIGFIPGYDAACIQKMLFREMFYVNETKEIAKTYFEIPTCCSCSLFRTDNNK